MGIGTRRGRWLLLGEHHRDHRTTEKSLQRAESNHALDVSGCAAEQLAIRYLVPLPVVGQSQEKRG